MLLLSLFTQQQHADDIAQSASHDDSSRSLSMSIGAVDRTESTTSMRCALLTSPWHGAIQLKRQRLSSRERPSTETHTRDVRSEIVVALIARHR